MIEAKSQSRSNPKIKRTVCFKAWISMRAMYAIYMIRRTLYFASITTMGIGLFSCEKPADLVKSHSSASSHSNKESVHALKVDENKQKWEHRLNPALEKITSTRNDKKAHALALGEVAQLYAEGLEKNWVHLLDVRHWCNEMAEQGTGYNGEAAIATYFLYGTGVTRDTIRAKEWFEYSLERNDNQRLNALYMLGLMHFSNDGVQQDINKALDYLYQASDAGHLPSMALLGRAHVEGGLGVSKDVKSGLCMLEKAANGGDVSASVYLGKMYAKGIGVNTNIEYAMKWYEQAALAGDAHSQYVLGLAHMEGEGVIKDKQKAFNLLKLSAGQNHVNAMLMLSVCYSTGCGTVQNSDLAEVWKKKAIELNQQRKAGKKAP